jgi:hypothetical protein
MALGILPCTLHPDHAPSTQGLLEPIWKIIERVMDKRLNVVQLHESLHGCRNGRGTGTAIIEAKLAQQLAHLEQRPFFGVFLDLKKAFVSMDRD